MGLTHQLTAKLLAPHPGVGKFPVHWALGIDVEALRGNSHMEASPPKMPRRHPCPRADDPSPRQEAGVESRRPGGPVRVQRVDPFPDADPSPASREAHPVSL